MPTSLDDFDAAIAAQDAQNKRAQTPAAPTLATVPRLGAPAAAPDMATPGADPFLSAIDAEIAKKDGKTAPAVQSPQVPFFDTDSPNDPPNPASPTANTTPYVPPTWSEWLKHGAGLTARGGIEGAVNTVAGAPALAIDLPLMMRPAEDPYKGAFWKWLNAHAGTNFSTGWTKPFAMNAVARAGDALATEAGTPQPKTENEELYTAGINGLVSAAAPGGFARAANISRAPLRFGTIPDTPPAMVPAFEFASPATKAKIAASQAAARDPQAVSRTAMEAASGASSSIASTASAQNGGDASANNEAGVLGGLAPWIAAWATRRALTPSTSSLTPQNQKYLDMAEQMGIPLSAGDRSGGFFTRTAEDIGSKMPGANAIWENPKALQQQKFTQVALEKAGIFGEPYATQEVLNKAHGTIGAELDHSLDGVAPVFDDQTKNDLNEAWTKYGANLPADQRPDVREILDDLQPSNANRMTEVMSSRPNPVVARQIPPYNTPPPRPMGNIIDDLAAGRNPAQPAELPSQQTLNPATYQAARTKLTQRIRSATLAGNSDQRTAYLNIRDALDDSADRVLRSQGPEGVARANQLTKARQKYANLLTIEDALARNKEDYAKGLLSTSALSQSLAANLGRKQYIRGAGDLNDLAQIGTLLKPQKSSGTTERNFALIGSIEAARQAWEMTHNPYVAAGAAALPTIAGTAINSPWGQHWLGNQRFAGAPVAPSVGSILSGANAVANNPEDLRRQAYIKQLQQ